ncbi:MAG: ABC transporter substrate-binding protein, partial [Pseudomonadota bacterium]
MKPLYLAALCAAVALPAGAETFRWAAGTDPQTMDPHAVNSAPVLGFLNNVYEGLVRRDKAMKIEGALAERWEPLGRDGWRYHLRQGVTFHDGAAFTAEDVLFSYQRAIHETSDVASWFAPVSEVVVVDDFTIDFMTTAPNPIFPDSIANFMILDKGWAEANGTPVPSKETETYATRNTNGTGAFKLVERQPGLKTVLEPFDGWWGESESNVTRAEFTPVQNAATSVAALLSGDVDMINPVPIQDAARVGARDGIEVIQGIEARVIMLGFPHQAETLKYGADAGKPNPFKDQRVRKAVAHAVNVDAILATIMRGSAAPASQLVSPAMRGFSEELSTRPAFDPEAANHVRYRRKRAGHLQCKGRYLAAQILGML